MATASLTSFRITKANLNYIRKNEISIRKVVEDHVKYHKALKRYSKKHTRSK